MEILINNLPPDITIQELRRLAGPQGHDACYQLVLRGSDDASWCCARVRVSDEDVHGEIIARLHGADYGGRTLAARALVQRHAHNDRRAPWWRAEPWHGVERRQGDRRRG